jgi:uncharacterized protein
MAVASTGVDVYDTLRTAAGRVLDDEPVLFAYLFGSHARATPEAHSDVDVAVLLDDSVSPAGYLDLSLRMAGALERATGVGPVEALVVLNEAPLPLAGRIVNEGRVIYSRDEPRRCRYESLIFRQFTDFDQMARSLEEELIRAHSEGRR